MKKILNVVLSTLLWLLPVDVHAEDSDRAAISEKYITCAAKTSSFMRLSQQRNLHIESGSPQKFMKMTDGYLKVGEAFSSKSYATEKYLQKAKDIERVVFLAKDSEAIRLYMINLATEVMDCASSSAKEYESLLPTVREYFQSNAGG